MEYYRRVCLGTYNNKGFLVPEQEAFSQVTDFEKPAFISVFKYTSSQFEKFQQTGTISGISDVVTNSLVWDFDNKNDISTAQNDTLSLIKNLKQEGIKDTSIQIYFSGNKGFTVQVDLEENITPAELKHVCVDWYGNNLSTLDRSIYNASRILRIPFTRHENGLYKIPLSLKDLKTLDSSQIKELAKNLDNAKEFEYTTEPILNQWRIPDVIQGNKPEPIVLSEIPERPNTWKACKWNILQGNFKDGERHNALMVLAATARGLGYDQDTAYYLCKAALKKQATLSGKDEFSKDELWNNIIKTSIFNNTWNGGTYSCKNDPWLSHYCTELGEHGCQGKGNDDEGCVEFSKMTEVFSNYAQNFDKNIIKTGIPGLDNNLTLVCSTLNGLLGQPGCHARDTEILMFDGSIKKVQDIVVGDLLMGPDSTSREVLKLQRGQDKMIQINPIKGESFVINQHHVLNLKPSISTNNKAFECNLNIMFKDYIDKTSKVVKNRYKFHRTGVEFKNNNYQVVPAYILGTWLGDGHSNSTTLTNKDVEVINEWKRYAKSQNLTFTSRNITHRISKKDDRNYFLDYLHGLEVINNKHIPKSYLTGTREQRLELLAGLMDTDGHLDNNNKGFDFISKYKHLSEQVVFVARSLGLAAYMKIAKKGCWYNGNYKEGIYYRVGISGDCSIIPTRIKRKRAKPRKMNKDILVTGFSYKELGHDDYFGFTLDKDHLYLTSDFMVHHNSGKTSTAIQMLRNTSMNNVPSIFFSMDMGLPIVYGKLLQRETGKSLKEVMQLVKNGDNSILKLMERINKEYQNVSFSFQSAVSVADMKRLIKERQEVTGQPVKLVVIDYLECIAGPYSEATANTGFIANQLKDLANDMNVCVLLLLQTQKHSTPDISDPLLTMKGVKGSSIIEQSCSTITTLWREGYSPENVQNDKYMSFAVVKNRFGSLWKGDFFWNGPKGIITPLTDSQEFELKKFKEEKKEKKAEQNNNGGFF